MRRITASLPVGARGTATAAVLTDATSPVYNPHSRVALTAALASPTDQLDPALPLMDGVR